REEVNRLTALARGGPRGPDRLSHFPPIRCVTRTAANRPVRRGRKTASAGTVDPDSEPHGAGGKPARPVPLGQTIPTLPRPGGMRQPPLGGPAPQRPTRRHLLRGRLPASRRGCAGRPRPETPVRRLPAGRPALLPRAIRGLHQARRTGLRSQL